MKRGFEGLAYYGPKGSTASQLIENREDLTYDIDPQMTPTHVAGSGAAPPKEAEAVTSVKFSATLKMKNKQGDSILTALRTAAAAGEPVAFRMKDYVSGKGYDGDVNVKESWSGPLSGGQTYDFTLTPNNLLREPQYYV